MKTTKFNLLLLIVIIFQACNNPDPVIDNEPPQKSDPTVWQIPVNESFNNHYYFPPILTNNFVIFVNQKTDANEIITIHDKKSGKIVKTIKDIGIKENIYINIIHNEKYLIIGCIYRFVVIDLIDFTIVKKIELKEKNIILKSEDYTVINDKLYYFASQITNNSVQKSTSTLYEHDLISDKIIARININIPESDCHVFHSLKNQINNEGENILYYYHQYHEPNTMKEVSDIHAFNLTKNKTKWINKSQSSRGEFAKIPILITDYHLFPQSVDEIFCINIENGQLVWKKTIFSEFIHYTSAVYSNDKIILKSHYTKMFCMDAKTGNPFWTIENLSLSRSNLVVYKNSVYTINGDNRNSGIISLNLEDGSPTITYPVDFIKHGSEAYFGNTAITIDEQSNYLYTNNSNFHICLKLPD
ncbi:MAG: PQQ-like beta-propeller repeat protein [Saprospiraceae bacterium]|nr:PQQ-like beta-propeller repeat protein [Saprospiraceae bacterium]